MYMLINGREVTKDEIAQAVLKGKAGIVNSEDIDGLVILNSAIDYSKPYYRRGKKVMIKKPVSIEMALEAAYF